MKGIIYKYTFPNGKVYIGQTRRDPAIRHREHLDPKIGPVNSAFWKAYQEQGEPKYEIIETHERDSRDELIEVLNARETAEIALHRSTNPEYGYNRVAAGMVPGRDQQTLLQAYNDMFGRLIEEYMPKFQTLCDKVFEKKELTEDEQKLYDEYFVEKNAYYPRPTSDMEEDFEDVGALDECEPTFDIDLFGDETMLDEWFEFAQFCYVEDLRTIADSFVYENRDYLLVNYIDSHSVLQLDLDGKPLARYATQIEAAYAVGAKNAACINNVVRGKQKTAHGYKWMYAKDYPNKEELLSLNK